MRPSSFVLVIIGTEADGIAQFLAAVEACRGSVGPMTVCGAYTASEGLDCLQARAETADLLRTEPSFASLHLVSSRPLFLRRGSSVSMAAVTASS